MEIPRRSGVDRLDEIEDVLWNAESAAERIAREIQVVLKNKKGVYTGDKVIDHVLLMTIGDCEPCGICKDSVDKAIRGVKHLISMRETLDKSRGEIVLRESVKNREYVLEYGRIAKEDDVIYLKSISGEFPKISETTEYYLSLGMFINTDGKHNVLRYRNAEKSRTNPSSDDMAYYVCGGKCKYLFSGEAEERLKVIPGALEKARRSR